MCLNLLALVQRLNIFGKKYTVDRIGLAKSCCVQTNDKYILLLCFHKCLLNTVSLSIQGLVEIRLWDNSHSNTENETIRFVVSNNSSVSSIRWTIAASDCDQLGWTRCRKHLLLNSPKWNPKLILSRRPQQQAIITHVVTIKFEGLSSHHHVTGCSDSAGEAQEPERREQDKSRITTLDFIRTDFGLFIKWLWRTHGIQQLPGEKGVQKSSLMPAGWGSWLMLYTQLATPYLEYHSSSGLPSTRDTCLLESGLSQDSKMLKELEHLSYEEKPSKQRLFSWEKWKLGREGVEYPPHEYLHLHLMEEGKGDGNILLSNIQWQAKRRWRKKK